MILILLVYVIELNFFCIKNTKKDIRNKDNGYFGKYQNIIRQ